MHAFVKEVEEETPLELPPLALSGYPNYVTPHGHARLLARLADAQARHAAVATGRIESQLERAYIGRDLRWLQARLESAIPVDPAAQPLGVVSFGSHVEVRDNTGTHAHFYIVGEDEADPGQGRISWVSPLARALSGARAGESVLWERPAGELELEVLTIGCG